MFAMSLEVNHLSVGVCQEWWMHSYDEWMCCACRFIQQIQVDSSTRPWMLLWLQLHKNSLDARQVYWLLACPAMARCCSIKTLQQFVNTTSSSTRGTAVASLHYTHSAHLIGQTKFIRKKVSTSFYDFVCQ